MNPAKLTQEQRQQMAERLGLPKDYFANYPNTPKPVFDKLK
jgi:hypothetical protein